MRQGILPTRPSAGYPPSSRATGADSSEARRTSSSTVKEVPEAAHASMHCLSSHMPLTALWKQIRLPTAPRLVNSSASAARELQGEPSSAPMSDHVPELM